MNNFNSRCFGVLTAICACFSYGIPVLANLSPPPTSTLLQMEEQWVDSTLATLTLEEKLGQLFLIKSSTKNSTELNAVMQSVKPGGILLNNVSLHSYVTSINKFRRNSSIPLLEVSDQILSVHNQFSNLPNLPSPATISAINNESLKQALENQLLEDLKTMGVNCSFAPNIHYSSPKEGSYSSLKNNENISTIFKNASHQIAALNTSNILSIVQGTNLASFSDEELQKEFNYFKFNGLSGVFFDEQAFQSGDFQNKQPNFLKTFLQNKLNFEGLVIGGLSKQATFIDFYYAGADLFIASDKEVEQIIRQVTQLIEQGVIDRKRIDEKVERILLAKTDIGLNKTSIEPLERTELVNRLRATPAHFLEELYEQSAIIAPSPKHTLPLATTFGKNRHIIHVSAKRLATLQRTAFEYVNASPHLYRPKADNSINPLSFTGEDDTYIIALDHLELSAKKNNPFLTSIHRLAQKNEVIIINFGNPSNLSLFTEACTLVHFFEKNKITEKLAIQILFGSATASGTMPIAVSSRLPYGYQQETSISRLKHTTPEQAGMKSEELYKIEAIVDRAIRQKAFPGCQVLVAKKGQIVYSKAFGHHTYEAKQRVERSDVYDIASITKTAATTLAMMKLQEEGIADLDKSLGSQMDLPGYSTIKNVTLKELLIHKSGLQTNMPIGRYLRRRLDCQTTYCDSQTTTHSQKIADQLYFNPQYQVDIWKAVNRLGQPDKYKYRKFLYSDVNFYLLQQFIESQTNSSLDEYVNEHFYKPLGLRYCLYNPLNRLPKYMIVPTQDDQKWRNELIRGTVHDETAALHSGIGGNAGLFSNAEDLAVLFQMLVNGGAYGGQAYLKPSTIQHFTSATHGNHRGLGFDKPMQTSTISRQASASTYGHNGFTGTCVWVDPANELIYIFLSNRIHPNKNNQALFKLGVRRKIHDVIYQAIDKSQSKETLLVNIAGE